MKVDLYTKTILTIIAGALLWLCATGRPLATAASAQERAQRVVIAGSDITVPVHMR